MWRLHCLLLTCYALSTSASPILNSGMMGMEEDATEFFQERSLGQYDHAEIEENEIDPRLTKIYPDDSIGPYSCTNDLQCANGGNCVATAKAGNVCNCTRNHLGPYCDFSASSIEQALRVHPAFKISFAECMTKAGKTAGINAPKVLSKCGGGQNLCWLQEGGIKGLKCFFWCLTNGMHLSLIEAKPSEESRLQLYAEVFQKIARERHLPEQRQPQRPSGVPIYSMQISLYDTSQSNYPYPQHNNFGLPSISIKPSVSFWAPGYNSVSPYVSSQPQPYESPYGSSKRNPVEETVPYGDRPYQYPKSHEIPTQSTDDFEEMGPVGHHNLEEYLVNLPNNMDPYGGHFHEELPESPSHTETPTEVSGTPDTNFLDHALHDVIRDIYNHNVVEADDAHDDDIHTSEFNPYSNIPYHDPLSNMRGAPLVEEGQD